MARKPRKSPSLDAGLAAQPVQLVPRPTVERFRRALQEAERTGRFEAGTVSELKAVLQQLDASCN